MRNQPDAAGYEALASQLDALQKQGFLEQAIDHWKQMQLESPPPDWVARRLKDAAALLNKRGVQLFKSNHIDEALSYFMLALRACADDAPALNNAANCLKELGRLDESTAMYRRALELYPTFAAAHSNILMNLQYTFGVTPAQLAAAHRAWDERHAKALRLPQRPCIDSEKTLHIGLVSADLGQHPVGVFLVRYLENIDRAKLIFTVYADGQREGPLAERMRAAVNDWHDVRGLDDETLAQKIAADNIDILIDLSGHSAGNRLGVFARKPAPVQIAWLGYPGDTGLSAMDYVIGDPLILPQSLQPYCAAKILHLPDGFVCFDPPADAPPVNALPATTPGKITFGCFSNPAKCGDEVIKLWAEILTRLPKSRLLLKYKGFGETSCRHKFEKQFAALGVNSSRLEFQGASNLPELFATMQKTDLALDPFPFSGGLMTCLTLWMGLPVLTWPGETFASRQGLSFLTNIGITDTFAASRQDYTDKAITLANDLPRLADLRQRLRPAMASSPLCNGLCAVTGLQNMLRNIWRDNCAASSKEN